jgi:acyl-CoA dehydrogenase
LSQYVLTEEQTAFRESVRSFAEHKIGPIAAEIDRRGEIPEDIYQGLVAAQLHAVGIPEEYGGDGADAIASAIAVEEIARVCASTSTILTSNRLGITPLLRFGSEQQKREYLPEVSSGRALMAYALSERDAGSDLSGIRCRATRDSGDLVLNGAKAWVTSAGRAELMIAFAVIDSDEQPKASAFIVRKGDEGVTYGAPESKMGLKGSLTREVYFDGCRIPGDRLLGPERKGIGVALSTLEHTRVSIAAQAVGIAQGALDSALAYVQQRHQFARPISDFQGVQFMLADMGMQIAAARQLVYSAASMSNLRRKDLAFYGAAAKCFASDVAMRVTTDAVQLFGGYGYTTDFPVERMMRDAKITQIYEGTNQIQRMVMARHLLAGH